MERKAKWLLFFLVELVNFECLFAAVILPLCTVFLALRTDHVARVLLRGGVVSVAAVLGWGATQWLRPRLRERWVLGARRIGGSVHEEGPLNLRGSEAVP